jgi:hypothetical protein
MAIGGRWSSHTAHILLTRPSVSSCVRQGCNPLKSFPGFSICGLTKNNVPTYFCFMTMPVLGTDQDWNRVTWETPSSEAIPFRRKPLGLRASYVTRRKRMYEVNKCG